MVNIDDPSAPTKDTENSETENQKRYLDEEKNMGIFIQKPIKGKTKEELARDEILQAHLKVYENSWTPLV